MSSPVSEIAAAPSEQARAHFESKLGVETDCWDVHESMRTGRADFVLLDVRSPALYAAGHAPGALNLPHGKVTARKMSQWSQDTLFVVYCAGPHCNAGDKAAMRLARLSRPVKLMIGGMTGWADEGFTFVSGGDPGAMTAAA
jgi:rhodanese-related sulfurtransferase